MALTVSLFHCLLFAILLGHSFVAGGWRQPGLKEFFSVFVLIAGCSQFMGLAQGAGNYVFLYGVVEWYTEAVILFSIGSSLLYAGMLVGEKWFHLPRMLILSAPLASQWLLPLFIICLIPFFFSSQIPSGFGVIRSALIQVIPYGLLFILVRHGGQQNDKRLLGLATLFTLSMALYNVFYAYLRIEMIMPVLVYGMALFTIPDKKISHFLNYRILSIGLYTLLFILLFPWFIRHRGVYGHGAERLAYIRDQSWSEMVTSTHNGENIFNRTGQLNQLSHIIDIAQKDGFYSGKTLSYLPVVWIPRILWPEKPRIGMGAWFASRLEDKSTEGIPLYQQSFTSSVNMTIPGELYLNFGWVGMAVGSFLAGLIFAFFWSRCMLYSAGKEVYWTGHVFAAYLLFLAIGYLGADLQIMITVTGLFLLLLMATWIQKWISSGGHRILHRMANP